MKGSRIFNFWPPFVDFMLFLVLLVIFTFSIAYSLIVNKYADLGRVPLCQQRIIDSLKKDNYFISYDSSGNSIVLKYKKDNFNYEITVINELQLQRIRVSSGLLFNKNEYKILPEGYIVLYTILKPIKSNLDCIQRIQIEGHADTDPTTKFRSNLELAGLRAFEIFYFIKDSMKIDPSRYLISAASFGEYKPVSRYEDMEFDEEKLKESNNSEELKFKNRRVEFLIFYKR